MGTYELWRQCTPRQCQELLLSFQLLEGRNWGPEKTLRCLYELGKHGERHYERRELPKKGGGTRQILAPDPILKEVQRAILAHILAGFTPADSAAAYRKGASIAANARLHERQPVLLKLDIQDFFGSITFPMVNRAAFPAAYFPPSVGALLTSLCCVRERLPQGAPTSPVISNLVMKPFDCAMEKWCGSRGIIYSRYCDDMTFSGSFDPEEARHKAGAFLAAMGFELNRRKTRIYTGSARRIVTGLVVNERAQTSREYRRRLRQQIYFLRRYGIEAPYEEYRHTLERLLGRVGFVLETRPEDAWFLEARAYLREALLARQE